MPAEFVSGFFVNQPAWHGLGTVLSYYPGKEEGMRLAGHDWTAEERPVYTAHPLPDPIPGQGPLYGLPERVEGFKAIVRSDTQGLLNVAPDSYTIVQNGQCWDILELLVNQPGVKYETAGVLAEGRQLWALAKLDEPMTIPGDDSETVPYFVVSWSHDGSGAVRAMGTSVRVVCSNTHQAAMYEASRRGTEFVFRHTKNVSARIDEARAAISGIRQETLEFVELARELATLPVSERGLRAFVTEFVPAPPEGTTSERVRNNIEEARSAVLEILNGANGTITADMRGTAYGLLEAGVEYLDHARRARNAETKFRRSMLQPEPLKRALVPLVRRIAEEFAA